MPPLASACLPYAGFGAVVATWQVLLADVVGRLGVGTGLLGLAITAGGLLSVPVMVGVGRVADRAGADRALAASTAGVLAGLVLYGTARSPAAFVAATLVFFVGFGGLDVAVSARAMVLEQRTGRGVLAPAYAAFSAGAAAAAIVTSLALRGGVPAGTTFAAAGALLVAAVLAGGRSPGAAAPRLRPPRRAVALLRDPVLAVLAGVVALAFVTQGSIESWTGIYLRDELGRSAALGGAGIAAFHLAMLAGRVLGATAGRRVGPHRLLVGGGVLIAAGMATALATTSLVGVVIGVALVGAASAVVVPTALSLAGAATTRGAGDTAAALATSGYLAALVAPGGIGLAAEGVGLRVALGLVVAVGVALALLGGSLRGRVAAPAMA